jgi:hypothetical protein
VSQYWYLVVVVAGVLVLALATLARRHSYGPNPSFLQHFGSEFSMSQIRKAVVGVETLGVLPDETELRQSALLWARLVGARRGEMWWRSAQWIGAVSASFVFYALPVPAVNVVGIQIVAGLFVIVHIANKWAHVVNARKAESLAG